MEKLSTMIQRLELPKVRVLGKPAGYEPATVELNLGKIKDRVETLEAENDVLKEQIERLKEGVVVEQHHTAPSPTIANNRDITIHEDDFQRKNKNLEKTLKKLILTATEQADEIETEAHKEAERIKQDALKQAEKIYEDAKARYEEKMVDADNLFKKAEEVRSRLRALQEYISQEKVI